MWLLPLMLGIAACAEELPVGPGLYGSQEWDRQEGAPAGWWRAGAGTGFTVGLDRERPRSGLAAAFLAGSQPGDGFVTVMQEVAAEPYHGQRVRWSGWVRTRGVQGDGGGLWLRVDGPGNLLAFDNMGVGEDERESPRPPRPLLGTTDWHRVSVVLDVPPTALGIALGVLLSGPGEILVDDMRLEIVDDSVASTDRLGSPEPTSLDSAEVADQYARSPMTPANLGFEGVAAFPNAAVDWLAAHSHALATATPDSPAPDLEPLREMVGLARVVGIGEGTHGTRQFFENKHRALRFLVRELGFTHFAIEATSPESDAINRYVLDGVGDPARLLSNLYFWTWNTREVLDLIRWIREWNLGASPDRQVRFVGFDMQFPGQAIDSVIAGVGRVVPADTAHVAAALECIRPYGNDGPQLLAPPTDYAALPDSVRTTCRQGLQGVESRIRERQSEYAAAMPDSAFRALLHNVRLVQQYEAAAAAAGEPGGYARARDAFMAENVLWLLEGAGPDSRMMLWAHNGHIARRAGGMGRYLGQALASDYLAVGQLFGTGTFNARGPDGTVRPWQATDVPHYALESAFLRTGEPLLLFDARQLEADDPASAFLSVPVPVRSIGARFDPTARHRRFAVRLLPDDFDLLIWVRESTPTRLLYDY